MIDCIAIGEVMWDLTVELEREVQKLEPGNVIYCNIELHPGGAAANVASGIAVLGGSAVFVGKVGRDLFSQLYIEDLEKRGVKVLRFIDEEAKAGFCVALARPNVERMIFAFQGYKNELTTKEIEEAREIIEDARFLYVSGFHMIRTRQAEAMMQAIDIARETETRILFDPADCEYIKRNRAIVHRVIKKSDVLFVRDIDAMAITRSTNLRKAIDNLKHVLIYTRRNKIDEFPTIIIRRTESRQSAAAQNEYILISAKGERKVSIESFKDRVRDTTGVDDAFSAALIYALSRGYELEKACRFAGWFAVEVSYRYGARSYPDRRSIEYAKKYFLER